MRYTFDAPIVKGGRTFCPVYGVAYDRKDGATDYGRCVVVRTYYPASQREPAIPRYGIAVAVGQLRGAVRVDPFDPLRSDRPAPMTAEERVMAEWYDGILRSDRQRRSAASIARRALRPGRLPDNLLVSGKGGAAILRRVARTLAHMGLRPRALWALCRALACAQEVKNG